MALFFGSTQPWRSGLRPERGDASAGGSGRNLLAQPELAGPANSFFVEIANVEQLRNRLTEWADLVDRALERNIFLEPAFALPAAQHLGEKGKLAFLLAWENSESAPRSRLMALWPVVFPRSPFGWFLRTWRHDYCCAGVPLLDQDNAQKSLDSIIRFLDAARPRLLALSVEQIPQSGAFFAFLSRHAARHERAIEYVARYHRAALNTIPREASAQNLAPAKKRKELKRQYRRLAERGEITFQIATEGEALEKGIESFLILESRGWKGRQGGAFLRRGGHAMFLRSMVRSLAQAGKCRIYSLACGERLISSNIVLTDEGVAYFWKTAFNEDFAAFSPGALLTLLMTESFLNEPDLIEADSCAIPNHSMIAHIWREKKAFSDMVISIRPGANWVARQLARREALVRLARERVKLMLGRLRRF